VPFCLPREQGFFEESEQRGRSGVYLDPSGSRIRLVVANRRANNRFRHAPAPLPPRRRQ
jgi:hypothetical protein